MNNLVGLGLLISVIFLSLAELILIYLFVLVSDTASNCILIQNHFHSVQVNIDPFPYYLHTIFHLVIQLTSDQSYQSPMTSFQYGISTNKLQFYHVCTFQFKVWHFNLPCILQSRNSRSQTYSVRWQYLGSVETGWNSASFNILTTYIQYKSLILVSLRAEPARIRQRDVQKVWQSVRHF